MSRADLIAVLHHTIFEAIRRQQLQRRMAVPPRDERYALADEDRNDTDDKFIDRLIVEKRRDDIAAAHQPDVLAGLRPKTADECCGSFADELDARWSVGGSRVAGEDDVPIGRIELLSPAQGDVKGPRAKTLGVDSLHEGVHAVETCRRRPGRQPFQVPIRTRDVAVRTRS